MIFKCTQCKTEYNVNEKFPKDVIRVEVNFCPSAFCESVEDYKESWVYCDKVKSSFTENKDQVELL